MLFNIGVGEQESEGVEGQLCELWSFMDNGVWMRLHTIYYQEYANKRGWKISTTGSLELTIFRLIQKHSLLDFHFMFLCM